MMLDKREGPRLVLTVGGLLAGLALIATSQVQAMWQFYLSFGAVFSVVSIIIGWQLLGPSVLSKWFVRLRGRAMGISAIGVSMGGFVIAPIAGLLVAEVDWRTAWIVLGVGMIVVLVPAGALLMRRQPSDVGLRPDGVAPANGNAGADAADVGGSSPPQAVVAEDIHGPCERLLARGHSGRWLWRRCWARPHWARRFSTRLRLCRTRDSGWEK